MFRSRTWQLLHGMNYECLITHIYESHQEVIRPKDRFLILYLFFLRKFQVTATASISRFVCQGNSLLDPAEQAPFLSLPMCRPWQLFALLSWLLILQQDPLTNTHTGQGTYLKDFLVKVRAFFPMKDTDNLSVHCPRRFLTATDAKRCSMLS